MADIAWDQTVKDAMDQRKGNDIIEQAKKDYPILNKIDMQYAITPKTNNGYLEFWPGDETGTTENPRPSTFSSGKPGVEIYDLKTRPIDVMGDIASHHLIYSDPKIKQIYDQFVGSMTPDQKSRLAEQYEYAKSHQQERRPYEQWAEHSGVPGYFRGYAFDQWPDAQQLYTPQQIQYFDEMMKYLRQP